MMQNHCDDQMDSSLNTQCSYNTNNKMQSENGVKMILVFVFQLRYLTFVFDDLILFALLLHPFFLFLLWLANIVSKHVPHKLHKPAILHMGLSTVSSVCEAENYKNWHSTISSTTITLTQGHKQKLRHSYLDFGLSTYHDDISVANLTMLLR